MNSVEAHDVFPNHNSADKATVELIAHRLREEVGLNPFLDKWHLIPGEPCQEALEEEALDACPVCAVFLGPAGIRLWENEEMRSALEERVRDRARRVIPVLLPGAPDPREHPLPRFLRRVTWVDFRSGLEDEDGFRRLVAGIRGQAPEPAARPVTPSVAEAIAEPKPPSLLPDEQRSYLQKVLAQYQRNLAELFLQKAKYGIRVPLDLVNEIRDSEAEIKRVEAVIAAPTSA